MMSFPYYLLSEKEMVKRIKEHLKKFGFDKKAINKHISKSVDHRTKLHELIGFKISRYVDEYEEIQDEINKNMEKDDERMEQDEIAEQAMNIIEEEEK